MKLIVFILGIVLGTCVGGVLGSEETREELIAFGVITLITGLTLVML